MGKGGESGWQSMGAGLEPRVFGSQVLIPSSVWVSGVRGRNWPRDMSSSCRLVGL